MPPLLSFRVPGLGPALMVLGIATLPRLFRRVLSSSRLPARLPAPTPALHTPLEPVKVALCQLAVVEDKQANIAAMRQAVREAARGGAALVVLPECWNGPYDVALFSTFAEDLGGAGAGRGAGFRGVSSVASYAQRAPSACALAEVAAETGVTLVGGSIPELCSGRLYNTCAVFDGAGALLGAHRKVHLFDVDIPGGITFRESDSLSPGDEATVLNTPVGRLGVGICFDIRFGELCAVQANRGAEVLVYPGAFNTVTGPLHWELLQRARAVDNQLFVLTCSPARAPAGYQAWGHSTAVGPFGEVLATCDEKPGIMYAQLDYSQLEARRRAIPLAEQRRGDVYALLDRGRA